MPTPVHRIEVWPHAGDDDPVAASVLLDARRFCGAQTDLRSARIYLIEASLPPDDLDRVASELLADPVNQTARLGATAAPAPGCMIEVHYKPGVMDPVADSARQAIVEMLDDLDRESISVRTGHRFDLSGDDPTPEDARRFAVGAVANPVIQDIHLEPYHPDRFEHGHPYTPTLRHIAIRDLDDKGLERLSREGHLFLSLEEMSAIAEHYRRAGREPTDIELETLAQTWSEHCVHKTLKATIRYEAQAPGAAIPGLGPDEIARRPGHRLNDDGSITIENLLASTIAASTRALMAQPDLEGWCISVFEDNAGIVRFDDEDGIAIKVETHNHPSAIEPYGGAATGIGGCIRDIMGTGRAAPPGANTDTFAVAPPDTTDVPSGVIHPKRVLQQVVAGVRDYGNRMGIATVNGSVCFDPDYLGNPLVFAGCVGIIPIRLAFGAPDPGDAIVVLGGRTGRDGIHGATFSSAELTDTHADEFSHAVQIGNAITQKKTLDVILQARDAPDGPLFTAITDCGAGGYSSAVGEMGEHVGAEVTLETAPLKYQGLSYTEIWISEAQERMVLAVPPRHVEALAELCVAEDVEMCRLGHFGATGEDGEPLLRLKYEDLEVGAMSMGFLHDGIPSTQRRATWQPQPAAPRAQPAAPAPDLAEMLITLLAHPNIASKHWIVRQYDHEVQGGSVVKPLVGPHQDGPSDAAVIRPKLASRRGVAIAAGQQNTIGEKASPEHAEDGDAYWMALASIDEAIRNTVCVGADASRIAILDNFCWPSCDDPAQLGALVRAAVACHDGALAYRAPFVSGKDSLNNQFTTDDGDILTIPPTLLITAVGLVEDTTRCVTMDAKAAGNRLVMVGRTTGAMGGSHYVRVTGDRSGDLRIPRVDLEADPAAAAAVSRLIRDGRVRSAHDCSDGGLLVAAAEMAMAGRLGLDLDLHAAGDDAIDAAALAFAETPGRYLLEITEANLLHVTGTCASGGVECRVIGTFTTGDRLVIDGDASVEIGVMHRAWRGTLDW
ncbi:MAG: phosphoribosylformylglycinamidine synthase [Phycisphaeraceae bacterium]|nr:phosphoribosylformylglycinamidine synthase [Phycisphaeraceae bacterium]